MALKPDGQVDTRCESRPGCRGGSASVGTGIVGEVVVTDYGNGRSLEGHPSAYEEFAPRGGL